MITTPSTSRITGQTVTIVRSDGRTEDLSATLEFADGCNVLLFDIPVVLDDGDELMITGTPEVIAGLLSTSETPG